eukprot:CAMPEP_0178925074 /NCGR_PEP_ID=MMETSP0786-20121207/17693_1 /TAXON_ID=186022 /ORGANISM="Thalassionema frauenfeldii, Strain CCMP 1798" /LENGTH=442 /DNA_ID=CAMNT_0020599881 /DNA_START=121 /DNA_END=1449 /DNA_ORIENTATION=-
MHRSSMGSSGRFSCSRRNRFIIVGVVSLLVIIAIGAIIGVAVSGDGLSPEMRAMRQELSKALKSAGAPDNGLFDQNSYQWDAFVWVFENNGQSYSRSQLLQRFALACFYYSTNKVTNLYTPTPPGWRMKGNWMTLDEECDWSGIECNAGGKVNQIQMGGNYLTGKVPMEIVLLREHLNTLNVTTNLLYMEYDDMAFFEQMTKLEHVVLDDNYIHTDDGVPTYLGACTDLKTLRMSYNLLYGALDNDLFHKLSNLEHLEVESNFLTGAMPNSIGKLKNLVYLYMRRNSMSFNLNFLKSGKLHNLFALWLDANDIEGTIPTEVGQLTGLASLSITNGTSLGGPIPTELGMLTDLRRLWLYNNKLTGAIPTELSELSKLEVFELQNNDLIGEVPTQVCTTIHFADYVHKALIADCNEVECANCCTKCGEAGVKPTETSTPNNVSP